MNETKNKVKSLINTLTYECVDGFESINKDLNELSQDYLIFSHAKKRN